MGSRDEHRVVTTREMIRVALTPKVRSSGFILALLVALNIPGMTAFGMDMFLRMDHLPGESTDYAHTNEIDVLAWSWFMFKPAPGAGRETKPSFGDLSLTKYIDSATPLLMKSCASGKPIPSAQFTLRTTGIHPVVFCSFALSNLVVVSIANGGSGGEDRLTENIALNFSAITVNYTPVSNGIPQNGLFFFWDIAANLGNSGPLKLPELPAVMLRSSLTFVNGTPTATLAWPGVLNGYYQVWAADNPSGPFQPYGGPTDATSLLVPASAIQKFFRIETLPPQ